MKLFYSDLSNTNIRELPVAGLGKLTSLYLKNSPKLIKFPRKSSLPSLREARVTYEYHCCALASAEKKRTAQENVYFRARSDFSPTKKLFRRQTHENYFDDENYVLGGLDTYGKF